MSRTERAERAVLILILLVVGSAAGWVSVSHVHAWTLENSPPGTPGAFGLVNAAVSELVPIAALLTIRQRRRTGTSTTYPMLLLFAAAALSLAAQLAVAKPSPSGWLLSAVPSLAFMALTKLVLSGSGKALPEAAPVVDEVQDVSPDVPEQPEDAHDVGGSLKPQARKRRPVAETKALAVALMAEQPNLSRNEVAGQLEISPRRLRTVLAA